MSASPRAGLTFSASSLEWVCRSLLREDPAALERKAAEAPPGANGLSFLPYLSGERTPLWSPWASGAMLGLRLSSRPADLARAVFEGLAAILAVATGRAADLVDASRRFTAIERWIEPQAHTRAAHCSAYERYRAASAALAPGFARDAGHHGD